jgi:hypothetical protein
MELLKLIWTSTTTPVVVAVVGVGVVGVSKYEKSVDQTRATILPLEVKIIYSEQRTRLPMELVVAVAVAVAVVVVVVVWWQSHLFGITKGIRHI